MSRLLLDSSPLFADMDQTAVSHIERILQPYSFRARQHIFHEGDAGNCLYLLEVGQVRVYVNGMDGSETSVIMFGRMGELFGELALIDEQPRSASAIAVRRTTLYALRRADFHRQIKQHPQLAINFMRLLSERVRYNTRQVDSLASMDVQQRLARKLLEYGHKYGIAKADHTTVISSTLRQSDLASLIGTTRESINKSLRALREQGIITANRGQITILNELALNELAM